MATTKTFVELEKASHDRVSFNCGAEELNTFIKQQALRHMKANISRTMVFVESSDKQAKQEISAFYTIAPSSISRQQLPKNKAKKLPAYPVPVFLLAQLAVDKKQQGTGLGKITLVKALEHLYRINAHMRAYAVVVDCLNKEAEGFYSKFGFEYLCENASGRVRLYLPMKQLEVLFSG
jgi:GNAT superfamily N-acetyltransferase